MSYPYNLSLWTDRQTDRALTRAMQVVQSCVSFDEEVLVHHVTTTELLHRFLQTMDIVVFCCCCQLFAQLRHITTSWQQYGNFQKLQLRKEGHLFYAQSIILINETFSVFKEVQNREIYSEMFCLFICLLV